MDVCVARQPIFDQGHQVEAYELLYRGDKSVVGDAATSSVIVNGFLAIGLETLTGGKRAYVNFTRNTLSTVSPVLLPPEQVVIELVEDLTPDPEVVDAVKRLKALGYSIALDDVVCYEPAYEPLFRLADIIKVDFAETARAQRDELIESLRRRSVLIVAEKIETQKDYEQAVAEGFDLFQGYFFRHPDLIGGRDIPVFKANYLRMLRTVLEPELDFGKLADCIAIDVSLTHKLLRCINAAAFGWRHRIDSVHQALVALGATEIRKWVTLVCLSALAADKPDELVVQSLVRARFCELSAGLADVPDHDGGLFLAGLLSLLDALLDRPMSEVLANLSVSRGIEAALLNEPGPLTDVLRACVAYESADWAELQNVAARLDVHPDHFARPYLEAVHLAQEVFSA